MHIFGTAKKVADDIRKMIKQRLSLNSSVGISHNKLLAKFASDQAKPDGVVSIKTEDVATVLDELEPDELCGIGQKTNQALREMGIYTLGQLKNCHVSLLKRKFGANGVNLHLMAQGIDELPVYTAEDEGPPKSIGHSMTFDNDISHPAEIHKYILMLSDKVGRRLRASLLDANCIRLTIRYKDFTTFTRQRSITSGTNDTKQIYAISVLILQSIRLSQPLRLVGVCSTKLKPSESQGSLFEEGKRKDSLNRLLDDAHERFGDQSVCFASVLEKNDHDTVISPSWRPYGSKRYK